jgi:hypothetical protein
MGSITDEQQTFVEANCFVNLLVDLSTALDAVWGKPAAHALVLQIGVEAFCKLLEVEPKGVGIEGRRCILVGNHTHRAEARPREETPPCHSRS